MSRKLGKTLTSTFFALMLCLMLLGVISTANAGSCVTLPEAELLSEFQKEWGPATVSKTDEPGPGVRFTFTGLSPNSGTGVGDNFPVNQLAGGKWKTYGTTQQFSTYGDFSEYTCYCLCFKNVDIEDCMVCIKMNTGWTIPPPEYAAMWRDTYWQSEWTSIAPGETKKIVLDFSSVGQVWNAQDEQEFTPYPDGTSGVPMYRIDEVSQIGFQVIGSGDGSLIVYPCQRGAPAPCVPEFPFILPVVMATSVIVYIIMGKKYRKT